MDKKLIESNVKSFLKKADKSLMVCKILFKDAFYEDTITKAYYTYLYFVKSLLIGQGIVVKSHSSARRQFALYFVKQKVIDVKYSKYFAKLSDNRLECDYDEKYIAEKFLAKEAIDMVEEFRREVLLYNKKWL